MSREVNNNADILDSRDVISRFKELTSDFECMYCAELLEPNGDDQAEWRTVDGGTIRCQEKQLGTGDDDPESSEHAPSGSVNVDDYEAFKLLKAFEQEGRDCFSSEWDDGVTLVRESYFTKYAQEFAEDIGAIDHKRANNWPYTCIDWEQAAEELQMDYSSVEFGRVTYWGR